MIVDARIRLAGDITLGFWGKLKAKILEYKMRRRWKRDPAFREMVNSRVRNGLRKIDIQHGAIE